VASFLLVKMGKFTPFHILCLSVLKCSFFPVEKTDTDGASTSENQEIAARPCPPINPSPDSRPKQDIEPAGKNKTSRPNAPHRRSAHFDRRIPGQGFPPAFTQDSNTGRWCENTSPISTEGYEIQSLSSSPEYSEGGSGSKWLVYILGAKTVLENFFHTLLNPKDPAGRQSTGIFLVCSSTCIILITVATYIGVIRVLMGSLSRAFPRPFTTASNLFFMNPLELKDNLEPQ
jgi:hypothetical protein